MSLLIGTRRAHLFPGPLLSPAELPGLAEWWDPAATVYQDSAGTTPAGDGQMVGSVPGRLGAYPLTQAGVDTLKPTLRTTGLNGRPALDFDGGDWLAADALAALYTGSGRPFTWFGVFRFDAYTSTPHLLVAGSSVVAVPYHRVFATTTGSRQFRRRNDGNTEKVLLGTSSDTGAATVWVARFNGTQGDLWINGVRDGDLSDLSTEPLTLNLFTLGAFRRTGVSSQFDGLAGVCGAYARALSDQETQRLSLWARLRYGL